MHLQVEIPSCGNTEGLIDPTAGETGEGRLDGKIANHFRLTLVDAVRSVSELGRIAESLTRRLLSTKRYNPKAIREDRRGLGRISILRVPRNALLTHEEGHRLTRTPQFLITTCQKNYSAKGARGVFTARVVVETYLLSHQWSTSVPAVASKLDAPSC